MKNVPDHGDNSLLRNVGLVELTEATSYTVKFGCTLHMALLVFIKKYFVFRACSTQLQQGSLIKSFITKCDQKRLSRCSVVNRRIILRWRKKVCDYMDSVTQVVITHLVQDVSSFDYEGQLSILPILKFL